jgi:hypothetical protein
MGLGIIMGAMEGAGDAGQQIAQQNTKQWDAQALAQQQSDLDTQKQLSLINLENQNAVGMLYQKNAADDANRDEQAQRIQAGMTPALQQSTIQNAQADSNYDWVPANAQLNPDGTAVAGTPTMAPVITDLSPADLAQYAPTVDQQNAAYLASARNTGDLGPVVIAASAAQQAQAKYATDAQLNSQNFQAKQQLLSQSFQSRIMAANQQRSIADMGEKARSFVGTGPSPMPAQTMAGLPAGSVRIGSSGGKPVYQAQDGRQYILQQ